MKTIRVLQILSVTLCGLAGLSAILQLPKMSTGVCFFGAATLVIITMLATIAVSIKENMEEES